MLKIIVLLFSLSALNITAEAKTHRSATVVRYFKLSHPCPSTGKRYGSCKGWIVDHVIALCVGGEDAVSNMQWQSVAEAKIKDKYECKGARR